MDRLLMVGESGAAFEAAGYEVVSTGTAREAMERLKRGAFELVIADVGMPDLDVKALAQLVRKRQGRSQLVLLAERLDNAVVVRGLADGATQVLQKPRVMAELIDAVGVMIRQDRPPSSSPRVTQPHREVTATVAKNEFARVLETAIHEGAVVITKHDEPRAVLMSFSEYEALSRAGGARLETLTEHFDALLARMQTPASRDGMRSAFAASPEDMGAAAVAAAAKKRG